MADHTVISTLEQGRTRQTSITLRPRERSTQSFVNMLVGLVERFVSS
jgi:hypothetical protein